MPNRLPYRTPAPDLDELKRDKAGEYALALFEIAVLSSLHYEDAGELLAWMFPPKQKSLKCKEALNEMFGKVMEANGLKGPSHPDPTTALKHLLTECTEIMYRAQPRTGRPATKQMPAVKALIHHQYLGTHWPKLANKFCNCSKPKHNSSCAAVLKAEVELLELKMKENQVELHRP